MGVGSEEGPIKEIVAKFKKEVTANDGTLISIPGLKSRLGESLYISTRFGEDQVGTGVSFLNVDVFAQRDDQFIPVGIYDWEVVGKRANGNKQRHGHLPATNQAHESADRYWSTGEAFHVRDDDLLKFATEAGDLNKMTELRQRGVVQDENQWTDSLYQGRGIGGLMIAVSAIVLESKGIEEMNVGTLSRDAQRAWKKFEIGGRSLVIPSELVNHDAAERVLIKSLM